jgi:diguanylate cyclase (GGDEF)-like protein
VLRCDALTPERLAVAVACGIERQRRMAELRDLTLTDALTGLHNRRGFRTLAEANLRLMRRTQRQSLLLFADVDQLKQINDVQGHAAGDLALQLCAEALSSTLRESDIVARYGGDEFVSLAVDVCDGAALVLLPRLAATLDGLARRARLRFPVTMSVGTATFGRGGLSLDEVLARADRALYAEKRRRGAARPLVPGVA